MVSFGEGEVESFKLLDNPKPIIQQFRRARRVERAQGVLGYIPRILSSTGEERNDQLTRIGLTALLEAERRAAPIEFARVIYPELTKDSNDEWDATVWEAFLPTVYSLEDFAYDSIPKAALDDIEEAQKSGLFDRIEIWSPEGNDFKSRRQEEAQRREILARSLDPMAVGILTNPNGVEQRFAITRWGESLKPFAEIKAYTQRVERQLRTLDVARRTGLVAMTGLVGIVMLSILAIFIIMSFTYPALAVFIILWVPMAFVAGLLLTEMHLRYW